MEKHKKTMVSKDDFPYLFDATRCETCGGRCCRGAQGYVWVSVKELKKMADSRNMGLTAFSNQYCLQSQGQISLKERTINGEHFCCFFDMISKNCTIYDARPEHCRTFPFWTQFKKDLTKLQDECPGVHLIN